MKQVTIMVDDLGAAKMIKKLQAKATARRIEFERVAADNHQATVSEKDLKAFLDRNHCSLDESGCIVATEGALEGEVLGQVLAA